MSQQVRKGNWENECLVEGWSKQAGSRAFHYYIIKRGSLCGKPTYWPYSYRKVVPTQFKKCKQCSRRLEKDGRVPH